MTSWKSELEYKMKTKKNNDEEAGPDTGRIEKAVTLALRHLGIIDKVDRAATNSTMALEDARKAYLVAMKIDEDNAMQRKAEEEALLARAHTYRTKVNGNSKK